MEFREQETATRLASQATPSIANTDIGIVGQSNDVVRFFRCLKGVVEVSENSPIEESRDKFDNRLSIAIDMTFEVDSLPRCVGYDFRL